MQKEQLKQAIESAKIAHQKGQEKTFFNALLAQCEKEKLDLTKCFPQYRVNDVKKLTKRNHILLQHLFKKSQCVFKQGLDLKGGVAFSLEINEKVLLGKSDHEKQQLVQKAIEVISSRIDSLGVS